jgi:hypothetical protein
MPAEMEPQQAPTEDARTTAWARQNPMMNHGRDEAAPRPSWRSAAIVQFFENAHTFNNIQQYEIGNERSKANACVVAREGAHGLAPLLRMPRRHSQMLFPSGRLVPSAPRSLLPLAMIRTRRIAGYGGQSVDSAPFRSVPRRFPK